MAAAANTTSLRMERPRSERRLVDPRPTCPRASDTRPRGQAERSPLRADRSHLEPVSARDAREIRGCMASTSRDDSSRVAMRSARRATGSSTSSNVEPDSVLTLRIVRQSTALRALPHLDGVRLQQMMQDAVHSAWRAFAKTNPFHRLEFNACMDDRAVGPSETGHIDMTRAASRGDSDEYQPAITGIHRLE